MVAIAARIYGVCRDRSGGLLLAHGIEVAQELGRAATPTAMSAAVLHGIPEDTDWTAEHLASVGVDPIVCEVIVVLTRRTGEPYTAYVRRVCAEPGVAGDTARLIMAADLGLSADQADSDALRERYQQSLPLVQQALATQVA